MMPRGRPAAWPRPRAQEILTPGAGTSIFVLGPAKPIISLPEMIARVTVGNARRAARNRLCAGTDKFDALPSALPARWAVRLSHRSRKAATSSAPSAWCPIPAAPNIRVQAADVVAEARSLAAQGVRELTLLGQNVNAYAGAGPDGEVWSLARLARALADIEGLSRIRYTTSHPRDMAQDLIDAHGEVEALMPYLHLPVQSGSDRVLKAMNRGHTADAYLRLVERIRAARGDMALSGDFIVGFPGETEAEFEATLQLVEAVGYASAFSFKYSPRPGTPAAALPDQVPEPVKAERLARLQDRLAAQTRAFSLSTVGRRLPVLLEKRGRQAGQLIGRSPYLQAVWTEAPDALLGQIVDIDIVSVGPNSLSGRLPSPSPLRGGSGWGATPTASSCPDNSPHPNPPLKGEGVFV